MEKYSTGSFDKKPINDNEKDYLPFLQDLYENNLAGMRKNISLYSDDILKSIVMAYSETKSAVTIENIHTQFENKLNSKLSIFQNVCEDQINIFKRAMLKGQNIDPEAIKDTINSAYANYTFEILRIYNIEKENLTELINDKTTNSKFIIFPLKDPD